MITITPDTRIRGLKALEQAAEIAAEIRAEALAPIDAFQENEGRPITIAFDAKYYSQMLNLELPFRLTPEIMKGRSAIPIGSNRPPSAVPQRMAIPDLGAIGEITGELTAYKLRGDTAATARAQEAADREGTKLPITLKFGGASSKDGSYMGVAWSAPGRVDGQGLVAIDADGAPQPGVRVQQRDLGNGQRELTFYTLENQMYAFATGAHGSTATVQRIVLAHSSQGPYVASYDYYHGVIGRNPPSPAYDQLFVHEWFNSTFAAPKPATPAAEAAPPTGWSVTTLR